jgi:hypothetical protein
MGHGSGGGSGENSREKVGAHFPINIIFFGFCETGSRSTGQTGLSVLLPQSSEGRGIQAARHPLIIFKREGGGVIFQVMVVLERLNVFYSPHEF